MLRFRLQVKSILSLTVELAMSRAGDNVIRQISKAPFGPISDFEQGLRLAKTYEERCVMLSSATAAFVNVVGVLSPCGLYAEVGHHHDSSLFGAPGPFELL